MSAPSKDRLINRIGTFTVIPNSVMKMLPEIGIDAFGFFSYLCFRANEIGECWPSYDTIQKDTGLTRHRISASIRTLEKFGLLERIKRFSNSTIYILKMPAISKDAELLDEEKEPVPVVRQVDYSSKTGRLPVVRQVDANKNQFNKTHINKTQLNTCAQTETVCTRAPDTISDPLHDFQEMDKHCTDAKKKGDILDAMLLYARPSGKFDLADYPEDTRPILESFCSLWSILPPRKTVKTGGEFALWIKEARWLIDACGEFGPALLEDIHCNWKNSDHRFTVGRPGALIKSARAKAGEKRSGLKAVPKTGSTTKFDQIAERNRKIMSDFMREQ